MMKSIQQLSQGSSRLLSSGNIISSILSVVKELIENALDSGANNVEVKLESYGLQKIEVRDNGTGIKRCQVHLVVKSHFTSKLSAISDLERIETYGFRGEALGAICAVGQLSITTKTDEDEFSMTYSFESNGDVKSSKPSAASSGTTVSVANLFYNIPVRKKYYKLERHKRDEMKQIEDLLCAFACAQPETRFALFHNQSLIWSKTGTAELKVVLIQVFGSSLVTNLELLQKDIGNKVKIEAFVPRKLVPLFHFARSTPDRTIVIINKRPVKIKAIEKLLQATYCCGAEESNAKNSYPICLLSLTIPPSQLDVNIDANKSQVLLHNLEEILQILADFLQENRQNSKISGNPPLQSSIPVVTAIPKLSKCKAVSKHDSKVRPTNGVLTDGSVITDSSLEKENSIPKEPTTVDSEFLPGRISNVLQDELQRHGLDISQITTLPMQQRKLSLHSSVQEQVNVSRISIEKANQTPGQDESIVRHETNRVSNVNNNGILREVLPPLASNPNHGLFNSEILEQPPVRGPTMHQTKLPSFQELFTSTAAPCQVLGTSLQGQTSKTNCESAVPLNEGGSNQSTGTEQGAQHPPSPRNRLPSLHHETQQDLIQMFTPSKDKVQSPSEATTSKINWTTGRTKEAYGKDLQPVSVMLPNQAKKRLIQDRTPDVQKRQKSLNRKSVVNATDKPMTPFNLFCRDTRLEVVAEDPEKNNKEIGLILFERWKNLSSEEQKAYTKSAQVQNRRSPLRRLKIQLSEKSNEKASAEKKGVFSKKAKEKLVTFNVSDLHNVANDQALTPCLADSALQPIGSLSTGVWICFQNRKLFLLNTNRVRETLLFRRLLETYRLKADGLSVPITISPQTLGDEEMYKALLSSVMTENEAQKLGDLLEGNGFRIQFQKAECEIQLVGLSSTVLSYGLRDLKELLNAVRNNKGSPMSLASCRPFKVIQYLQGEAVRISRQSLFIKTKNDLNDLLSQANQHLANCTECFHNKPFQHELYDFANNSMSTPGM